VGWAVLGLVVAGAACTGDSRLVEPAPASTSGTVRAPAQPVIVRPLPAGWSVKDAQRAEEGPVYQQSLYLAPGSSADRGPALAVGQHDQDMGSGLCTSPVGIPVFNGPTHTVVRRTGDLIEIGWEIDTDQPGYVLGRGLTEAQVVAAARAANITRTSATIGADGLPPKFRRVATAPVVPNALLGERITLVRDDGEHSVWIGAYDTSGAAKTLARFWRATVNDRNCRWQYVRRTAVDVGDTTVYVEGGTSRRIVREVASNLVKTDEKGWAAFRKQRDVLPARGLLNGCAASRRGVILEGTERDLRWVVAMDTSDGVDTCTVIAQDGQPVGGSSMGSGTGSLAGPGTSGITVLANGVSMTGAGSLQVVGGTVPAATTKVVIRDGTGASTAAQLLTIGDQEQDQYFAGLLRATSSSPAALQVTVIAYGPGNEELGRFNPPG
jgi:hypothetical protein